MQFDPHNSIVQRCLQGMNMEEQDRREEARKLFLQAWSEATSDFEKFLAAYYVARHQSDVSSKLKWIETALQFAIQLNDVAVEAAFSPLYRDIAKCYEDLNDIENAKKNSALANSFTDKPKDEGPFYHGTKADLQVGDLLTPGNRSNYKADVIMNHIYFTALANGAGLAAELAQGDGSPHVYIVEPTGSYEHDPNLTNHKFPGNLTRSYRTQTPLKIVGEVTDWARQTPEQLQHWHERLANSKGKIIN